MLTLFTGVKIPPGPHPTPCPPPPPESDEKVGTSPTDGRKGVKEKLFLWWRLRRHHKNNILIPPLPHRETAGEKRQRERGRKRFPQRGLFQHPPPGRERGGSGGAAVGGGARSAKADQWPAAQEGRRLGRAPRGEASRAVAFGVALQSARKHEGGERRSRPNPLFLRSGQVQSCFTPPDTPASPLRSPRPGGPGPPSRCGPHSGRTRSR